MKKLMYIFLALPILTGCKEKKSTGAMGGCLLYTSDAADE